MFLLWLLVLIGIPLVLGLRSRVKRLEGELARHQTELQTLTERLRRLRRDGVTEDGEPIVAKPPVAAPPPLAPPPAAAERPPLEPKREAPSPPAAPVRPPIAPSAPAYQAKTETPPPPPPRPPRLEPPRLPPEPPPAPAFAIDWEAFVGVKLFSAIAGIALVLAAIFFLRYSIEQGWLGPPIRVAIGVIVATALLVVCELKAARKYAVTANALDAAAIAILFATFYAARALWDLIPASVTFGLLILVTVLAVLLSIRHDSRFIAVLGLLGGFATPALLSTGENRPIPLFAYLLLLNAGLAWVAFKKGWPLLTILTLDPDRDLSVGLGHQVPRQRPAVAGDGDLPRLLGDVVCGADSRPPRSRTQRRRRRNRPRARAHRCRGRADAAAVRRVPCGGSTARRRSGAAVRISVAPRRRPSGDRHRASRRVAARRCGGHHARRVRHLARQISERRADDGSALYGASACCSICCHQ